jgi:SET domain-containing protein
MTKEELLTELQQYTWVGLQASSVHGVGVFALCDIPKGCTTLFAPGRRYGWITLNWEEIAQLPAHVKDFIETYYLYDEEKYFIPDFGCKIMDMASYLNHSSSPNIISRNEGEYFESLRDIHKGEELLVDYGSIAPGTEYE